MTAQTAAAVCVLFLLALSGALSDPPPASIWVRPMGDAAAGDAAPALAAAGAGDGSAADLPAPIM
jgi:hypothetical protein